MAYRGTGASHVWINFNGGGTVAIRDSYNVSSVTDNGTGQYQVNISTAFTDTYAVTTAGGGGTGSVSDGCNVHDIDLDHWQSEWGNGGTVYDFARCCFIASGDN